MLDIKAVPTNIITGFLGAGKTTTILDLLKDKPEDERWAVLVNEFGEIGVDGSLMAGEEGVFVQEVPGGCMCCAANLPMQVALNVLLKQSRPQRLLIEPTGLGHPTEVMAVLTKPFYQDVLDIQATITLIDARNLKDERYTSHDTFNEQITIADRIVGNKTDLYDQDDKTNLSAYLDKLGCGDTPLSYTTKGKLDWQWLGYAASAGDCQAHDHEHHDHEHHHHNEGYQTRSWQFEQHQLFDRDKLKATFARISVVRLKGVFNTSDGVFGYNKTLDDVEEMPLSEAQPSKVEVINPELMDEWGEWIEACRL